MADTSRLPKPLIENYEWQFDGACRQADPELFFHPDGERGAKRANRERAAKAVCATCPVIEQCAKHALSVREPFGVWGGMSEEDRELIYSRMDRSRKAARAA